MARHNVFPTSIDPLKTLSVVIPARNEEGCIISTVQGLYEKLRQNNIEHEIIVVDDGSSDRTWEFLTQLRKSIPSLRPVQNLRAHGFGRAIIFGLNEVQNDAVVIMMADASDDSEDVVRYWRKLNEGYDCVFGSRFIKGGKVVDYPSVKWFFNRLANGFIQMIFGLPLNDTTNAFKAYRRSVIEGCAPLISPHFNLTVELPLKAIVRGYSWTTIPISWQNRKTGVAKLKINEMGSRYLFIILYIWLERALSRGDYLKKTNPAKATTTQNEAQPSLLEKK